MNRLLEFFDNMNELVYVLDIEDHSLVYVNKKGLAILGLSSMEEASGKMCYELLQNSSLPCTTCNPEELKTGYFKEYRYYNPVLDRYLMMKETILEEDGRKYRLEIAIDIGVQVQRGNMAGRYQNLEAIINEGLRVALQEKKPSGTLAVLLEYLGKALNGERTYIFEKNEKGGDDNTYEWTAKGVMPEKENLQDLPPSVCESWYKSFSAGRHIMIEDLEDIRFTNPVQYEVLKNQKIHSLVVVPLYDNEKTIGFFGVDNPPGKSMEYASNMLQITAHFIVSCLKQRNLVKRLEERSYDIFKSLNVDYAGIFEINFDTDKCEVYKKIEQPWGSMDLNLEFCKSYEKAMENYISLYVSEWDQENLRTVTEKSYVIEQLKTKKKYYMRYQVKENAQNAENFEVHFASMGNDSHKVILAFRNVDSVVKEEEQYKLETRQNVEDILAGSRTGMWSLELEEGCSPRMYADRTMRMLLGVEENIGPEECYQSWFSNIDPEYTDLVQESVKEILESGRSETVYPWNHPKLGKIYIRCGGVPDSSFSKKGVCLKGYHQDITETMVTRQKQEKAILEALDKAQRANSAKSEFLSHMSHDIRTPINGILGMLTISEKNPYDMERQRECRAKIKISAEHLLSLINDVLEISKLERGEISLQEESFDLCDLLESCMTITSPRASEMGINLEMKPLHIQHRKLLGSPLHIRQILINIMGNAIKYNREKGSVWILAEEISSEKDMAQYRFVVQDTGIGIGEEFQKNIFEPFTQENHDARTEYRGTGLGMSITKKLVDQMGGTIQLESQIGIGSTFTVCLPIRIDTEIELKEEPAVMEVAGDISGMNILLVDDNEINCEIVQYILEDAGASVAIAGDGLEAVETFEKSPCGSFDCILMDLMMPVMDGMEASKTIRSLERSDAKRIPIIALSANAFEEDAKAAKAAGMNEHLAKPVDIEKMLKTISYLVKAAEEKVPGGRC